MSVDSTNGTHYQMRRDELTFVSENVISLGIFAKKELLFGCFCPYLLNDWRYAKSKAMCCI